MNDNARKSLKLAIILIICIIGALVNIVDIEYNDLTKNILESDGSNILRIISSTENKDLEPIIQSYANQNNFEVEIEYAGTIEIMDKLNNKEQYDAVWMSNSIWLYMLDDSISLKNSKSTSINPVVFGIKESKAKELGFIGKQVYTEDILNAIKAKKLKFNMSSATQTNTGATAYLGFLNTLAGSPEVLTEQYLQDNTLKQQLQYLFTGVTRSSGSDEFLDEMFLNGDYEAVITYETSIININKKLQEQNKEPLIAIYPIDGVSISDSPLAYIDNKNETKLENFNKLQTYILSNQGQQELVKTGRRVWYGGTSEVADKTVFNPDWGIDTTKYLVPIKYPNTQVIKKALEIYQTELRKPTHIVFCLDYSGSMYGEGNQQLVEAMEYILTQEKASQNMVQFSEKDKISIIPFNSEVLGKWQTEQGNNTTQLLKNIESEKVRGGTNIYVAIEKALSILEQEDFNTYNCSIILMTDGMSNSGTFEEVSSKYNKMGKDIPIFSIMFGEAEREQLEQISQFTNAKIFDGRTNLLGAFKEVRGYN